MKHKKQHWVSKAYLEAWCDPSTPEGHEPYVWLFQKESKVGKRKAPKNIFFENEMYTIPDSDGTRNLSLEKWFSFLEGTFVKIRDSKLSQKRPLDSEELAALRAFVSSMHTRSQAQRDHLSAQWKRIHDFGEEFKHKMLEKTPEERQRIARSSIVQNDDKVLTQKEVLELAQWPLQQMLIPMAEAEDRTLAKMNMVILSTESNPGFISSDSPCTWHDPNWSVTKPLTGPYRIMESPAIEIFMPLSPHQLIWFTWEKDFEGYIDLESGEPVDSFNQKTRYYCKEFFLANTIKPKDIWFTQGVPISEKR